MGWCFMGREGLTMEFTKVQGELRVTPCAAVIDSYHGVHGVAGRTPCDSVRRCG